MAATTLAEFMDSITGSTQHTGKAFGVPGEQASAGPVSLASTAASDGPSVGEFLKMLHTLMSTQVFDQQNQSGGGARTLWLK